VEYSTSFHPADEMVWNIPYHSVTKNTLGKKMLDSASEKEWVGK